jgi:hypothetical protein
VTHKTVRGGKMPLPILTYCLRSYPKRQRKTKNSQSVNSSASTTILTVRHTLHCIDGSGLKKVENFKLNSIAELQE